VGYVLAGLVPDSGEIVASSIEEYKVKYLKISDLCSSPCYTAYYVKQA
jgi:hypothetical protein